MQTTAQSIALSMNESIAFEIYQRCILESSSLEFDFINNSQVKNFQEQINYQFKNSELLIQAFTHKSFAHEYLKAKVNNYERLEFLGDSILGCFVSFKLFHEFENLKEGFLSKIKNSLVNEDKLFELSKILNIHNLILVGKGELTQPLSKSIVSDVFEAVIGAISLDSNIQNAFNFLMSAISEYENSKKDPFFDLGNLDTFDYKSSLQEMTMKKFKCLPEYIATKDGEEFEVSVSVLGKVLCTTKNVSKKNAMKILAQKCIEDKLLETIN